MAGIDRLPKRSRTVALAALFWLPAPALPGADPLPRQAAVEAAGPIRAGMPLAEALRELERRGLRIVYSSRLVTPELRVAAPPGRREPLAILDEILAPHGLVARAGPRSRWIVEKRAAAEPAARTAGTVRSRRGGEPLAGVVVTAPGSGRSTATDATGSFELDGLAPGPLLLELRRPGYVVERFDAVATRAGAATTADYSLLPAPFAGDEIVVHPSRVSLLAADAGAAVGIGHEELAALPHLGNDVLRALELLPGVASTDLSAQFHVRGSRRDEVLLLLDGQELYEGFHLRDVDSALSLVAASNLGGVRLTTGVYPAEYGDRAGGVLEMTSVEPPSGTHFRVGANLLAFEAEASGRPAGGAVSWLLSGRRGFAGLAERVVGRDQPGFWDLFARLDRRWTGGQSLRAHLLSAADRLSLHEVGDGERKQQDTSYDNDYLWLTHQAPLSRTLVVDTLVSFHRSRRDRRDDELDVDKALVVADRRDTEVRALEQTWNAALGERHAIKAGALWRRFETDYDYAIAREFLNSLASLHPEPRDLVASTVTELADSHLGAFLSDQIRAGERLTLELGLRWDRHSLVGEGELAPRAHLAWAPGARDLLRAGWGRATQSQRTYELAIEDGDLALAGLESTDQWVLGYEHAFATPRRAGAEALRLELYRRAGRAPRPRWENLLEPFDPFPEGAVDRHRFAPTTTRARGVELFVRGRGGARLGWWFACALAASEDRIDGRMVPRLVDQRHTLSADLDWRPAPGWSLNLAGQFHTGRPTTAVGLDPGDGDPESVLPVYGEINAGRLPNYIRLDLRLSHSRPVRGGELTLFLDVQNLAARGNRAGASVELDPESGLPVLLPEEWPRLFVSAGFSWRF